MRSLASGKAVTQFSVATNEYIGQGKEKAEYHNIVTWDRLAQTCGEFLGKGQQVAIEGRIQTRSWDDDAGKRQCQCSPTAQPGHTLRAWMRSRAYPMNSQPPGWPSVSTSKPASSSGAALARLPGRPGQLTRPGYSATKSSAPPPRPSSHTSSN